MLTQIEDLKNHSKSLELEKATLKEELFKANDNYSKLTNKYVELTEILANIQKGPERLSTTESHTTLTAREGRITPRNKEISDKNDEVGAKLNEFMAANRVSSSHFIKMDDGSYTFNGKKVYLKVLNKKLVARQGGGTYKPIDEFYKANRTKERTRTPPPASRREQYMMELGSPSGKKPVKSRDHTPEGKVNESLTLHKVDNMRKFSPVRESQNKSILKDHDRDDLQGESISDLGKNLKDVRASRNENMKQKEIVPLKPGEKKIVTTNLYKFKGKNHKDLSPVLIKPHPKHF